MTTEPSAIIGETVVLEPTRGDQAAELAELDWLRALHPGMAGPVGAARVPGGRTMVARSRATGAAVAVLDSNTMLGYVDVRNVSIYADVAAARGPEALEAYGRFVLDELAGGARLIHHEVLELNHPIRRSFRALGLEPTARLRDHAYAAGRHWDVLVYSYDGSTLDGILARVFPRARRREGPTRERADGDTFPPALAPSAEPSGGQN